MMQKFTFRLDFWVYEGTPNTSDTPVPYPRYDIGFEPPVGGTLNLICETLSENGNCTYMDMHGELLISGWYNNNQDNLLDDYSVTLGNTLALITLQQRKA